MFKNIQSEKQNTNCDVESFKFSPASGVKFPFCSVLKLLCRWLGLKHELTKHAASAKQTRLPPTNSLVVLRSLFNHFTWTAWWTVVTNACIGDQKPRSWSLPERARLLRYKASSSTAHFGQRVSILGTSEEEFGARRKIIPRGQTQPIRHLCFWNWQANNSNFPRGIIACI